MSMIFIITVYQQFFSLFVIIILEIFSLDCLYLFLWFLAPTCMLMIPKCRYTAQTFLFSFSLCMKTICWTFPDDTSWAPQLRMSETEGSNFILKTALPSKCLSQQIHLFPFLNTSWICCLSSIMVTDTLFRPSLYHTGNTDIAPYIIPLQPVLLSSGPFPTPGCHFPP